MKKMNKQKMFLGLLTVCTLSCVTVLEAPSKDSLTKDKSEKVGMLTNDLALTAYDLKTSQKEILNQEEGIDVSEVSISVGSGNIEIATKEDTNVPLVTAAETVSGTAADFITPTAVTAAPATTAAITVTTEAVEPVVTAEAVSAPPENEWDNKAMAKVEDSANIREMPDAESQLEGRLKKGDAADILERGEEWTKISSGNVTGYVKNDYLAFDEEAEQLAAQYGKKTATIQTETLRVRKETSEESEIVDLVSGEGKYAVVNEAGDWVEIRLNSGKTGYVAAEYVSVELELGKAVSIEEERKAEEEAKRKAEAKAKEKAKTENEAVEASSKGAQVKQKEAVSATTDDITLLGAVIQMEAGGEGYDCKLAVASVVMNRVSSSRYPNSISGVVYQSGQFPGASNGKLSRILRNGVKSSCLEVAREALDGKRNVDYLHFNMKTAVSTSRLSDYAIIGSECFY